MFDGETINTMADDPLPIDVPSHADTVKFVDKTGPFDPASDRVETQPKFRRFVYTATL